MNKTTLLKMGLAGVVACTLAGTSSAQGTVWVTAGDSNYDFFGQSCDLIGDLNGDGISEVLVGATGDDNNAQECGHVRVLNGATGMQLFAHDGDSLNDEMGFAVAGLGDINNDGVNDYAAGARYDDNLAAGGGMVRVFSGVSGAQLLQIDGAGVDDVLGSSISFIGDVDGDGRNDILIGAKQKNDAITGPGPGPGYAGVYSGATGTLIYQVNGAVVNDQFAYDLDGGRDLNGDGTNDFVVGIYGEDTAGSNAGAVNAYDGSNGALLWTAYGTSARDHFGNAVALIGDVNADGTPDVVVGALEDDNAGVNAGAAHVLNGATGATLTVIDGENKLDFFGWSVSGYADVNADGIEEFLVGAPNVDGSFGADSGRLYVIDGATLSSLMHTDGMLAGDRVGYDCAGGYDVSGDGLADFINGCPQYFGSGQNNGRGYVSVHDTTGTPPPPPPTWPNLPSTFVSVMPNGYFEDFESHAGIIPSSMATNELDMFFRSPDADAWCNIGQWAPCLSANSGSYCLEMGGNPVMSGHHEVANGLVIGIDGTGSTHLVVDFAGINYGEENQADDGIWVSDNGTDWHQVQTYWANFAQVGVWEQFNGVDLTGTPVDTTTQFYLLFAQADNYEYGNADGIGIDDISVHEWVAPGPDLTLTPFPPVAGAPVTLNVANNNPGDMVICGYSFVGGGPTNTAYGTLMLTPPFSQFPAMIANAGGNATLPANVPPVVAGWNVWLHGLNFTQVVWTNPIATTFQ